MYSCDVVPAKRGATPWPNTYRAVLFTQLFTTFRLHRVLLCSLLVVCGDFYLILVLGWKEASFIILFPDRDFQNLPFGIWGHGLGPLGGIWMGGGQVDRQFQTWWFRRTWIETGLWGIGLNDFLPGVFFQCYSFITWLTCLTCLYILSVSFACFLPPTTYLQPTYPQQP